MTSQRSFTAGSRSESTGPTAGQIRYTTSPGPDGRVIYHPFRAVPASYQTPNGLVTGIQWVALRDTQVLPVGAQPANRQFMASWKHGHLTPEDEEAFKQWQRHEEKRLRKEEELAKRIDSTIEHVSPEFVVPPLPSIPQIRAPSPRGPSLPYIPSKTPSPPSPLPYVPSRTPSPPYIPSRTPSPPSPLPYVPRAPSPPYIPSRISSPLSTVPYIPSRTRSPPLPPLLPLLSPTISLSPPPLFQTPSPPVTLSWYRRPTRTPLPPAIPFQKFYQPTGFTPAIADFPGDREPYGGRPASDLTNRFRDTAINSRADHINLEAQPGYNAPPPQTTQSFVRSRRNSMQRDVRNSFSSGKISLRTLTSIFSSKIRPAEPSGSPSRRSYSYAAASGSGSGGGKVQVYPRYANENGA